MAKRYNRIFKEYNFSGFGKKTDNEPKRLINKDGSTNVKKIGLNFFDHFSVFHFLVKTSWALFNSLVVATYIGINMFFGGLYYLAGAQYIMVNATNNTDAFLKCFYFSAQTFSTVGYGGMHPEGTMANLIAVTEMLIGMMYLALVTGLLFAKFSRPVFKVIFSGHAIIAPYQGGKGLMVRLANAKENLLLDLQARIMITLKLVNNGKTERKFYILPLELDHIDILVTSWTLVHPINEESPLWDMSQEEFNASDAEIMVSINGLNDTFSQNIHARTSYKNYDVVWGAKFKPIIKNTNGKTHINVRDVGEYEQAVVN